MKTSELRNGPYKEPVLAISGEEHEKGRGKNPFA
jgi:hypothetical protein